MDEKFLKELADRLGAAGFDAKLDGGNLVVSGCQYSATARRQNDGRVRVDFLGSGFGPAKGTKDKYDYERALGLVVASLPKRLAEREAIRRRVENTAVLREKYQARTLSRGATVFMVNGAELAVEMDGKIAVVYTFDTVEEAVAFVENALDRKSTRL